MGWSDIAARFPQILAASEMTDVRISTANRLWTGNLEEYLTRLIESADEAGNGNLIYAAEYIYSSLPKIFERERDSFLFFLLFVRKKKNKDGSKNSAC